MSEPLDRIKAEFQNANWLNRLIYINLAVFALMIVVNAIDFLFPFGLSAIVHSNLELPSDLTTFLFKPWTLVTYMFVHYGFVHILFNLLVLFFTGKLFMEFFGDKRLLPVYFYGGVAGGLLFVLLYNISPSLMAGAPMVGASAGIMAIVVATATRAPNLPVRLFFVLEVKLWIVAVGFVFLDFVNISDGNTGGHIAHLAGALIGYLYVQRLNKGVDWSNGFWDVSRRIGSIFQRKPKLKTVHKNERYRKTTNTTNTSNRQSSDQKKMDEILDKIKAHGYDKLSKDEKDFLFQFSKK